MSERIKSARRESDARSTTLARRKNRRKLAQLAKAKKKAYYLSLESK